MSELQTVNSVGNKTVELAKSKSLYGSRESGELVVGDELTTSLSQLPRDSSTINQVSLYSNSIEFASSIPITSISRPERQSFEDLSIYGLLPEGTVLYGWRLVESVSSRIIEIFDDSVMIECLIDRDNRIYQERIMRKSVFPDEQLIVGNLFKLDLKERKGGVSMELKFSRERILDGDFPESKLAEKFRKLPIKKE